jgi:hypothetical protein
MTRSVAQRTRFLSRLLGLYCLIMGLIMLVDKPALIGTVSLLLRDRPAMLVLGVLLVLGALALILAHNTWSGGPASVIVSLGGWIALLKGVSLIALTPAQAADFYLGYLRYQHLYGLYVAVTLVLGAYLSYAGFREAGE